MTIIKKKQAIRVAELSFRRLWLVKNLKVFKKNVSFYKVTVRFSVAAPGRRGSFGDFQQ